VRWPNLAAASLGGHIESTTSVFEQRGWSADQLIDGGTGDIVCAPLCAWPREVPVPLERGDQHRQERLEPLPADPA
jgi:hypothetical protein